MEISFSVSSANQVLESPEGKRPFFQGSWSRPVKERDAMKRYRGRFVKEGAAYGFFMNAKDDEGKPPPNLPALGGVFLAEQVAKETLGNNPALMDTMNGETFMFSIRDSALHHGKIEAYRVQSVDNQTI